jgi:hypothetical protein
MRRTALLALPILLAALVSTASADDRDLCNDGKAARERRLTACTNAIASKQWRGTDLANLYVVRAEQYVFGRQRALDKALDDCNAAIVTDSKYAQGCSQRACGKRGLIPRARSCSAMARSKSLRS